jgi:catechol 2,3-dioxygenase-like lactoylglutathione lyase family enzyme
MATSEFPSEGMELAAYETLVGRGAEFLTPPVDYEWEVRCFFRDPDGHLLEISESKPSAGGS